MPKCYAGGKRRSMPPTGNLGTNNRLKTDLRKEIVMKNFRPVVKFMGVCDNEAFEVTKTVIYLYSLIIG